MDYSPYKQLEFRRKFFTIFGTAIIMYDPNNKAVLGYIKEKFLSLRGDVRLFRDSTMQEEIIRIGGKQVVSLKPTYAVFDSPTGQQICTLRRSSLRSQFIHDHWDLLDVQGNIFGTVQETSSTLAIARRWIEIIPYIGPLIGLILLFVPQTYDVMYTLPGAQPLLEAKIIHRKNPIIVKLGVDTSMAQTTFDPRVNIAIASMLTILDADKNA
jgi:hypothetical protein